MRDKILSRYVYDESTGKLFHKRTIGRAIKGKEAGIVQKNGYKAIIVDKKKINIHKVIWLLHNEEATDIVDHINRNKLDNRIANLRSVNNTVNCENSIGKGWVYVKDRNKPYCARIVIKKKQTHLGYFKTADEANAAYLVAKNTYHAIGERSFNE